MGHLHILSSDPEAHKKFWVDFLGGTVTKYGPMEMYQFPGVVVAVRKGAPTGGSNGSAVNHLGFKVRDLEGYLGRARTMGVPIVREMPETRQAFVLAPDEVRVELTEDKSQTAVVEHHHIHFFNTAVDETKAWYAKTFGAIPGKRGRFEAADLPGVNLSFSKAETATAPTKGRAVDHIGFEVKNLEAFVKMLEGEGVKMDIPYRRVESLGLSVAFFTDPWGTYIELTEGLRK